MIGRRTDRGVCAVSAKWAELRHLSDISSSWPSFIHTTWMPGSETSHSNVALFFSVIFRSFRCLVNSTTRAADRTRTTCLRPKLQAGPPRSLSRLENLTLHVELGGGSGRAGPEGVLGAVPEVDVPEAQAVGPLSAARLAAVRGADLHAVLQPLVGDVLVVNGHLEGDGVLLLGTDVLQLRRDGDG